MDRKRSYRVVIIIALLLVIAGLSIAYAALSQVLTINGTGTIKGSTWNIEFENLNTPVITGNTIIDTPAELINNSTTMTFAVSLKQPGDSLTYTFDVANNGTIDAEISEISLIGVSAAEAADVIYQLTYNDGTQIAAGDRLLANERKELKLTVIFDSSAVTVPEEDIVLNLGATITYVQI